MGLIWVWVRVVGRVGLASGYPHASCVLDACYGSYDWACDRNRARHACIDCTCAAVHGNLLAEKIDLIPTIPTYEFKNIGTSCETKKRQAERGEQEQEQGNKKQRTGQTKHVHTQIRNAIRNKTRQNEKKGRADAWSCGAVVVRQRPSDHHHPSVGLLRAPPSALPPFQLGLHTR